MNRCLARLVGILLIAHLCLSVVLSAGVLASDSQEVVDLTQRETSTDADFVLVSEGEKASLSLSPSLQDERELLSLVRALSQKVDASLARESERDSERESLRAEVAQLASHNAQLQAQLLSLQRESAFNSSLLGEQERALSTAMQSLHDAQQRQRERCTHTESALALLEEREKVRESEGETHAQAVRALTQQAHAAEMALSAVAENNKETRVSLLSLVERVQALEKEMLALAQSVETQNTATQRMQNELATERKGSEEMSEKVSKALARVDEAESAVRRVEKELHVVSGRTHTIDVATARLESELKSASVECASQYAYLQEVLATHTERAAAESTETQEVLEDAVLSVRALKERETHTRAEMQQTMREVRELHAALVYNVSLSQSSLSNAQSVLEAALRESLRESVEWRETAQRNASHTQDALSSLSSELRTALAQANTQARANEETRTQLDALRTHTLASQSALQSDLSQALLALTQVSTQAQSALAQALRERVEPLRTEAERSQRAHASLRKEVLSLAEQLRAVQVAQESLSAHASSSVWTATKEGARSLITKISSKITSKIRMGLHNRPPHTYTHRALSHTAHTPQKERSLPGGTETEVITETKTEAEPHSTDPAAVSLPHSDTTGAETEKKTDVEKESEKGSRSHQQSENEL